MEVVVVDYQNRLTTEGRLPKMYDCSPVVVGDPLICSSLLLVQECGPFKGAMGCLT